MRRSIVPAMIVLALIVGACSSSPRQASSSEKALANSKAYQCSIGAAACGVSDPAPNPHPGSPVGALPGDCAKYPEHCGLKAVSIPGVTPKLPQFLTTVDFQKYCSRQFAFCISLPIDRTGHGLNPNLSYPVLTSGSGTTAMFYSELLVNRKTHQFCPVFTPALAQCKGFDTESYVVTVETHKGWTEQQAMTEVKQSLASGDYNQVTSGDFSGNPEIDSEFFVGNGNFGSRTDVWHDGRLYTLVTTGQTGYATLDVPFKLSLEFI